MRSISTKFFAVVALSLGLAACRAPAPPESVVPPSWLGTPDQTVEQGVDLNSPAATRLGAAMDQVLDVHHQVLESVNTQEPAAFLSAPGAGCFERWHLGGYVTQVAVTIGGVLGSLSGSGTAAAQAKWLPVDSKIEPKSLQARSIRIRETSTPKELQKQLEPVVQGALGTGLIHDEQRFRTTLTEAAQSFQTVARALGSFELRGRRWQPDVFRLEVQFDANGSVGLLLAVGGGVLVRFDWEKQKGAAPAPVPRFEPRAASTADRLAQRVRAFVGAVGEDLDVLDEDAGQIEGQGLKLHEVRIGAGFTVEGDAVGFAEATARVTGSFEFHPQDEPSDRALALAIPGEEQIDGETLPMFASASAVQAFRADGMRIDDEPLSDRDSGHRLLVRIKRSTFRKGLQRANRMAAFFAGRAARANVGRWRISELSTEFDMSLAGSLGIATVGGTGVVELTYANSNK